MFSFSLQHRVAYLNVSSQISFHRSVDRWRPDPREDTRGWKRVSRQTNSIELLETEAVEVNSDCLFPISAKHGGAIHVNGDLKSHLELGEHHEVVISGDVAEGATIVASGIHHLYVGGAMRGSIRSTDGAEIWVDGDFVGSLETGTPSTSLNIGGDLLGTIEPYAKAALLWLTVNGFASQETLVAISKLAYTMFDASVEQSDGEPGFFPTMNALKKTKTSRSMSSWCIKSSNGKR